MEAHMETSKPVNASHALSAPNSIPPLPLRSRQQTRQDEVPTEKPAPGTDVATATP